MNKEELKLCYVDSPWAYFTDKPVDKVWGDDWNDAPYEHNAGTPYEYALRVAYDGDFRTPSDCTLNSVYSVENINKGITPWLRTWKDNAWIFAGTPYDGFCQWVKANGGTVYEPKPICTVCGGTGQDDPAPGKYHGLCEHCGGTGYE
jgi:hypothetical protein